MTDEEITQAAREICAAQADKQDNSDSTRYLSGQYDSTVWMRLVEQGIRKGVEQHEAFKQEVSDAAAMMLTEPHIKPSVQWALTKFIIPKPKPDPLAEAWIEATGNTVGMEPLRAALEARGFEIREKGQ